MMRLEHLSSWLASPDPALLSDAGLRLARHIPDIHDVLSTHLTDPIRRALVGLERVDPTAQGSLSDQVRAAIAAAESGQSIDVTWLSGLEARAMAEDPMLWPLAARALVLSHPERERAARILLSIQDLPYAFPGDVNDTQVALFAAGDRVLPALHVDWARKLTGLVCDSMVSDIRTQGLWSWPSLQVMEQRQVTRTLRKLLRRARRMAPGCVGLVAAYLEQVGVPSSTELHGADGLILDLARATRKRTHP